MKRWSWCLLGLALAFPTLAGGDPFETLLQEAGLVLTPSSGFHRMPAQANELLPYEGALAHDRLPLLVRYSIRPLARMRVEYDDPHSSAPEPDHLFNLMFESLRDDLSGGGDAPTRIYRPGDARKRFGADWAAASVFDLAPDYPAPYRQALFLALHKNHRADVYTLFLYSDYERVKGPLHQAMEMLRFAPAEKARAGRQGRQ